MFLNIMGGVLLSHKEQHDTVYQKWMGLGGEGVQLGKKGTRGQKE